MRRRLIENPMEFDFEELETFGKQMDTLEREQADFVREGVCDECGAYSVVAKVAGRLVCNTCSRTLNISERKSSSRKK